MADMLPNVSRMTYLPKATLGRNCAAMFKKLCRLIFLTNKNLHGYGCIWFVMNCWLVNETATRS